MKKIIGIIIIAVFFFMMIFHPWLFFGESLKDCLIILGGVVGGLAVILFAIWLIKSD